MSNTDNSLVVGLLLVDPDTHERLEVTSPLKVNKDDSYSFACLNVKTGVMWKHTIKTEEITLSEMRKLAGVGNLRTAGRGAKKTRRRKIDPADEGMVATTIVSKSMK